MEQVTLYQQSDARIVITIWAYLSEGKLVIAGQDIDRAGHDTVGTIWGSSEHEYFYSISAEDTQKLHLLLKKETNIDKEILFLVGRYFGGEDACKLFRDYCEANGIEVEMHSF